MSFHTRTLPPWERDTETERDHYYRHKKQFFTYYPHATSRDFDEYYRECAHRKEVIMHSNMPQATIKKEPNLNLLLLLCN